MEAAYAGMKVGEPQHVEAKLAEARQQLLEAGIRQVLHRELPFLNEGATHEAAGAVASLVAQHVRVMFGAS